MYFKSKPGQYWSEDDQELLVRGIKQFGVGKDEQIRDRFLPRKTVQEVHLRTCLLVGAHDLTRAAGIKSKARLDALHEEHRQLGESSGLWRYGLYLNLPRPT